MGGAGMQTASTAIKDTCARRCRSEFSSGRQNCGSEVQEMGAQVKQKVDDKVPE
jgi:hypothetical protein